MTETSQPLPIVVIAGRANVGKSTLFNRLVGRKISLVDDQPGVTRDWKQAEGSLGDLHFTLFDTAGIEADNQPIALNMRLFTMKAVKKANLCLMVIDARIGVTPQDEDVARQLRETGLPVVLLANKCEGKTGLAGISESWRIGFGDPVPVSAAHGEGLDGLYEAMLPYIKPQIEEDVDLEEDQPESDEEYEKRPLTITIVGRPNAGKSTLINAFLGQERLLTGPEPGITRDSIANDLEWNGTAIRLIDTAGLRKKARLEEKLESLAAQESLRSIRMSEVVILVSDVNQALEKQDLQIARYVAEEGRVLVLAINKWDEVENQEKVRRQIQEKAALLLPQLKGVRLVTISALYKRGLDRLITECNNSYDIWNSRIPTAKLNLWLADMVSNHAPPMVNGKNNRLRYITQIKARPPSFALFASRPDDLPEDYIRYLTNGLREHFGLSGTPIRFKIRGPQKNPYQS
ncbi:MAG: ribosome biogenesis GTPase Der [Alphaproteobacteria bacterium]